MNDWYKPERMVIAGVGMQHEELVELAEKEFGVMVPTSPAASSSSTLHQTGTTQSQPSGSKHFATVSNVGSNEFQELAGARATYTGGEEYIEKPDEEFVHLYVGFEGLGIHDPDIVRHHILVSGFS